MSYAEILQHSISWSFHGEGAPDALDDASEERIAQCIRNGFREGELYVQAEDDGTEYRGWWSIAQPERERVSELEAQVAQLNAELAALRGERAALVAQVAAANAQEPAFWANSGVLSMVKEMDFGAVGLSCRKTPDADVPLHTTRPIPDAMQAQAPRIKWPKSREVGRLGDMAPRGHSHMQVILDADSDVCVHIWEQEGDDGQLAGIEFCCPGIGGGKSPRTREALLALMVAMEEDNAAEPRGAFPLGNPS